MAYEYSDLEIKAILGAEDITYNPNFLSFLTKKIRGGQLIEQQESIIAYLKRLANIRAFYPQALKVFEEIVLLEPQKLKNYFETVEKICRKKHEKRILENLSKRSLNFIGILAPQRKYQSEIIDNLGICKHFPRQWQISALRNLSGFCPKDALGLREIFRNKLQQTARQCQTDNERDILNAIAREIHVYIPELDKKPRP